MAQPPVKEADANLESLLDAGRKQALEADHRLATRCAAGEVAAWEECYSRFHEPLVASVRALLGRRTHDSNLIDEIAAQVWYAMVAKDGKLLRRYDPARGGRLLTFMRAIAKDVIRRRVRSERRRLGRERTACQHKPDHQPAEQEYLDSSVGEFLGTLRPAERRFCDEHLLAVPATGVTGGNGALSRASFWQRSRRIYRRLLGFLAGES